MSSRVGLRILLAVVAAGILPSCGNINDDLDVIPFTYRVSVSSTGGQGDRQSGEAAVSGNGRYVVFTSFATNLVLPPLFPNTSQIYRRDLLLGITEQVSVGPGNVSGDDSSSRPAISFDGRYVAFGSFATNLMAVTQINPFQVYVRDMNAAPGSGIQVVSQDALGNSGDDVSAGPSISADGRYVAFESMATIFGDTHTSGVNKIYRRDMNGTSIIPISVTPTGGDPTSQPNPPPPAPPTQFGSVTASISADGSVIAYASDCTNILPGDTNMKVNVFVATVGTGGAITTKLASHNSAGVTGTDTSASPSISADGLTVAFQSKATDLIPTNLNSGFFDIYVYSMADGSVALVSVNSQGIQPAQATSLHPSLSSDGRFVAFESTASNLVVGDTNLTDDIFIRDRSSGTTIRVSVDTGGNQAGPSQPSQSPSISADGKVAAFKSLAAFVNDDTNGVYDVYVRAPLQ
jgi:Tol biopolymer transport system component